MSSFKSTLVCLLACAALGACAELNAYLPPLPSLPAMPVATVSARVIGLYVQAAPNVLAERSGNSAESGLPLFAEVRLPARDGAPSRLATVRVEGISVGIGDLVEVSLAESGQARITGARPAQARVVRVQEPAANPVAAHQAARRLAAQ